MANDAIATAAIIERLKRIGNITVRLAPGFTDFSDAQLNRRHQAV
jgi:hypothetical protein